VSGGGTGFWHAMANMLAEDMGTIDLMNKHLLPAFATHGTEPSALPWGNIRLSMTQRFC